MLSGKILFFSIEKIKHLYQDHCTYSGDTIFLKGAIKPFNSSEHKIKINTKTHLIFEDSTGYLPCYLEYEDRNISIVNKTIIVFKWSFIRNGRNNCVNHTDKLEGYLEFSDFALEKTVILDKHTINDNEGQNYKIKNSMIDLNDIFYALSKYQVSASLENTFFDLKDKVLVNTDSAFNIFNCVKNNFRNSDENSKGKKDTNVISLIGKLTWVSQILRDKTLSNENSSDNYIFYMILSNYNERNNNFKKLNLYDNNDKSVLIKCDLASFLWVQNLAKVDEIYLIENLRLEKKFLEDPTNIDSPAIYSFTTTSNIFLISLDNKKYDILKKLAYFNFDFDSCNKSPTPKKLGNNLITMQPSNIKNKRITVSGIITDKSEFGFIEVDNKSMIHLYKCMNSFDMTLLKKNSEVWIDGLEEIKHIDKSSNTNFKRIYLASVISQVRVLKFSRNQEKYSTLKETKDAIEKKVFQEICSKCAFNLNPHRIRRLLKCVRRSHYIDFIQLSSKHYFTFLNAAIFKCCNKPHHDCAFNPAPIHLSYNDVSSEIIEYFNSMSLTHKNEEIGSNDLCENPRVVTVAEVESLFETNMHHVASYKCRNFTWQCKQLNSHWKHLSLLLLGVIVRRTSCGNVIKIMDNTTEVDCIMTDFVDIGSVDENNQHSDQKSQQISSFHFCANSKTCKSFCLFTTGFEDNSCDGQREEETSGLKIRNEMLQMPSCPYMQQNHLDCLVRIDKFKLIQEIFTSNDNYDGKPKTFTKNYIVFSGRDVVSFGHVDLINLGISFYPYYPEENDLFSIDKNNADINKDSTTCKTFNKILKTFFSSSMLPKPSVYQMSLNDSPSVSVIASSNKSTPNKYVVLPSMATPTFESPVTDVHFREESPFSDLSLSPIDETFTPNYTSFQNIILSDAFKSDIELMNRLRYENFIIKKYTKMLEYVEHDDDDEVETSPINICQCVLTFIPIGIEDIKLKFKNKDPKNACSSSTTYGFNVFGMVIDVNNEDCKHCTHLGNNSKNKLNTLFKKYVMNIDENEENDIDETEKNCKDHKKETRLKNKNMILIKVSDDHLDWYYSLKVGCVYQLIITKEINIKKKIGWFS